MKKFIIIISILTFIFFSFAKDNTEEKQGVKDPSELFTSLDEKSDHKKPESDISKNIAIIKDIFHIAFFISIAILALLSYLQAKKTIFSPIKTEIFKCQLAVFEEVISHFQSKSEVELKEDMDMDSIIEINSFELLNSYISIFMEGEVRIDEKFTKEKMSIVRGAVVSNEYAEEYFQLVGTKAPVVPDNENPHDPALKLAKWNDRKCGFVHFTEGYVKATDEIKRFQNSPLLPSRLKELLKDYSTLMHETLATVGEAVEEAGKGMPANFPTTDTLKNFTSAWVSNIHNNKAPKLEPKAIEILNFINEYLGIDNLAKETV